MLAIGCRFSFSNNTSPYFLDVDTINGKTIAPIPLEALFIDTPTIRHFSLRISTVAVGMFPLPCVVAVTVFIFSAWLFSLSPTALASAAMPSTLSVVSVGGDSIRIICSVHGVLLNLCCKSSAASSQAAVALVCVSAFLPVLVRASIRHRQETECTLYADRVQVQQFL